MQTSSGQFLDLRRAENAIPFSRRKLQNLIKEGRLPAYRLDGKVILKRTDIERLITVGAELDKLANEAMREVLK